MMLGEHNITAKFIKRLKRGDEKSYKILYDYLGPQMKLICLRYAKNSAVAEDIYQEGFIKVYENISKLKSPEALVSWMKRIFINTSISYYRELQKQQTSNIENHSEVETGLYEEVEFNEKSNTIKKGDKNISFQQLQEVEFQQEDILNVLILIPEHFSIVFQMFVIDNLKHKEIAKMLSINEKTSKTRLLRARKLVKEKLIEKAFEKLNG